MRAAEIENIVLTLATSCDFNNVKTEKQYQNSETFYKILSKLILGFLVS